MQSPLARARAEERDTLAALEGAAKILQQQSGFRLTYAQAYQMALKGNHAVYARYLRAKQVLSAYGDLGSASE